MIPGGYYIKARKIQESAIATASPCIREIWDWLIKEANHTDTGNIKRGQMFRSYEDIQEGLKWFAGWRKMTYSKWDCERAMKWLKKATMIATRKTTRGLIITICNYDLYQNPKNYESHNENLEKTTRTPQTRHTINKNDKNDKNKEYTIDFEKFWKSYPGRSPGSKEAGFKAWSKRKDLPTIETLLECLQRQVKERETAAEINAFVPEWPMVSTYLNQGRWNDIIFKNQIKIESSSDWICKKCHKKTSSLRSGLCQECYEGG